MQTQMLGKIMELEEFFKLKDAPKKKDFCKKVGISFPNLSRLLNGEFSEPVLTLWKIQDATGNLVKEEDWKASYEKNKKIKAEKEKSNENPG